MKLAGWIFLIVSWGIVLLGTVWCIWRVMTSRRHWQHPEQDVEKLHHGEFTPKT